MDTHPAGGQLVGYARVSTRNQSLDSQLDELKAAGCARVFQEKLTGTLASRPKFDHALDYLRPGDVLVVTRLSRLGRSLRQLVLTVDDLRDRGVELRSLHEQIDTTTPAGRMVFHTFAAQAEFVRDLIVEGTREGLAAARARGRVGGRPSAMTPDKLTAARRLIDDGMTVTKAAATIGVSRPTLYRHLDNTGQRPSGRVMTRHAFVDESFDREFLMAVAVVPAGDVNADRAVIRGLLRSGQRRIHFNDERPQRRDEILAVLDVLDIAATVYVTKNRREARGLCLMRIVPDLAAAGVTRLVVERDESLLPFDRRTLAALDPTALPRPRVRPPEGLRRPSPRPTRRDRLVLGQGRPMACTRRQLHDRTRAVDSAKPRSPVVRLAAGLTSSG